MRSQSWKDTKDSLAVEILLKNHVEQNLDDEMLLMDKVTLPIVIRSVD